MLRSNLSHWKRIVVKEGRITIPVACYLFHRANVVVAKVQSVDQEETVLVRFDVANFLGHCYAIQLGVYLGTANWLPAFTKNHTLDHSLPNFFRLGRSQERDCQQWQQESPANGASLYPLN